MVRLFNRGVHHFHVLKNSWSISRSRLEIKVDISKLTKSTKTLVVRLRRQQVLTCVPNLSSKPSVARDTSRSNLIQLAHSLQCFQWRFRRQLKIISRK